jgi:membrane associated rhomboid family serine protease
VTTALISINGGIYLLQLAGGASISADSGWIFEHGALYGPLVAEGDWYRLLTAAFLHYGPIHLGMNMLALWWIGRPLEAALGPVKYLLLYLVSGLAGSAGALIANPTAVTVGASGAIFGILGAAIVLERQQTLVLGGGAMGLLFVNLAFTFVVPGISIGGHLGGLAGGALAALVLSRFGQRSAVYSRFDLVSAAGLAAVGIASIAVAYWKVKGYA